MASRPSRGIVLEGGVMQGDLNRQVNNGSGSDYCGRIAPTPSGFLHLGHARTFWVAQCRAQTREGRIVLRIEDLDPNRSRPEFIAAAEEDLAWFGIRWDEGPCFQRDRTDRYRVALERLIDAGRVYRCYCSRKDIQSAVQAPHVSDEGPLYPGTCRGHVGREKDRNHSRRPCWRFSVDKLPRVSFVDACCGQRDFGCGVDFGDFVVWRQDDVPAYQLAAVVDDHEMGVTEVVRGEDLLLSTARQILLYDALGWELPEFFHCPLLTDESGARLSKRSDSMSLRDYRARGWSPEALRAELDWSGLLE